MKAKFLIALSLSVLLISLLNVGFNLIETKTVEGATDAQTGQIRMLWNSSMQVNDVAVSKDGNYIVAANDTGIYYFASTNSSPKWWYITPGIAMSIAISADGEYVVAGDAAYIYYFNDSMARTGEQPSSTWRSANLWGSIERGTLDMSEDGEYVAVGGTGESLYYFAGCRGRSGIYEVSTWNNGFLVEFFAVHMSSDGSYVAAGGTNWTSGAGFVIFYKDANTEPYPTQPSWKSWSSINSTIRDLAVSDDGYAVVAVDVVAPETLYYWANATALSGDPNATWTNSGNFESVDMSEDGNRVVAGSSFLPGLYFWSNARARQGTQLEDWVRIESEYVLDVAMSYDGSIIAAATRAVANASDYKAYFYSSDGDEIGQFALLQRSLLVSISANGYVAAVGGPGYDSLYVFVPEFPSIVMLSLFMILTLLAVIVYRIKRLTFHHK